MVAEANTASIIKQRDISDLRFGTEYNENTRNIFSTGIKVADNGNQYAQGTIAYVEYPQIRKSGRVGMQTQCSFR